MDKSTTTKLKSILLLSWYGDIKLWQAFWLVNILGNFLTVITAIIIVYALHLLGLKIPIFFYGLPLSIYAVFSAVTLWRCSSKSIGSFRGALIKLYVIMFSIYMFPIILRFFGAIKN